MADLQSERKPSIKLAPVVGLPERQVVMALPIAEYRYDPNVWEDEKTWQEGFEEVREILASQVKDDESVITGRSLVYDPESHKYTYMVHLEFGKYIPDEIWKLVEDVPCQETAEILSEFVSETAMVVARTVLDISSKKLEELYNKKGDKDGNSSDECE